MAIFVMKTFIYLHLFSAWLSLILFVLRGGLQLQAKDWRQYKLLRILPHITDTVLLLSGLSFLIFFLFPLMTWLLIKIVALVLYIILAAKAFKRQNPQNRLLLPALICFIAAMLLGYFH
ncbi:hypothetical protein JL12_11210 [Gallibacterium anatis 10672-6]|nr:hypothetical protein JL12_11210 [Gallibacterium anatis 10672-6]